MKVDHEDTGSPTTHDVLGATIRVGMRVRVLEIDAAVLSEFAHEDPARLHSMVGEILAVYDVDPHGRAWVEKWWYENEDGPMSHSVALDPRQMEAVGRADD